MISSELYQRMNSRLVDSYQSGNTLYEMLISISPFPLPRLSYDDCDLRVVSLIKCAKIKQIGEKLSSIETQIREPGRRYQGHSNCDCEYCRAVRKQGRPPFACRCLWSWWEAGHQRKLGWCQRLSMEVINILPTSCSGKIQPGE